MCGIAGLMNMSEDGRDNREDMQIMRDRMLHRGPDGGGTWSSPDRICTLGHQRLSILDLSANGAQPMISHSGRTVMVFNGEIYNYAEVRQRLVRDAAAAGRSMTFYSTCDTEVLQEAIEFYGAEKALRLCRGMFAIGIYELQERVLTLARDRVGEKPLYYGWVRTAPDGGTVTADGSRRERFVFASDIGSIRALPGFSNPVHEGVLDLYFEHGVIPAPYSIYENIYKLEPGTILTVHAPFTEECVRSAAYWSMTQTAIRGQRDLFSGSRREAADELERLLRRAVREQMMADVPLGAFLSAGIDSPTIVSLMQQESAKAVRTFTIGMEDPAYNEAACAREIAEHLDTEHTELTITEEDAMSVIPLLPRMFSEPFADSSQIPTYLVSRLTREYVTVSLSGDAGDELFCGYYDYPGTKRKWDKIKSIPYPLRRTAGALGARSPLSRREMWRVKCQILQAESPEEVYRLSFETDPLAGAIALRHGEPPYVRSGSRRGPHGETGYDTLPYAYTQTGRDVTGEVCHDVMLMDLNMYHPDDILVKVDRTAMAVSLETRVPFLDRDVVEFAWTLPLEYLREGDVGKLVLRDVLYRYVPEEMMNRPKKGFSVPIRKWLKTPRLRAWAEELIAPDRIRRENLLDAGIVQYIWRDFIDNDRWRVQIWYILMFQAWMEEEYMRTKPA